MNRQHKQFCRAATLAFGLAALALSGTASMADDYPNKIIHIMVATAGGGPTDLAARLFANYVSEHSGQQAVVENRPGAGGTMALGTTARAAPDGYTLSYAAAGEIVIHPFLYKHLSYDPLKDVIPVAMTAQAPQVLVISAQVPAHNLREFIDYAKANPNKVNFGSSGTGGTPHLGALKFGKLAGLQLTHVPYRGSQLATADLIAGRIQMMHITPLAVVGPARAGQLRILTIAQPQRSPQLPDVPTSAEAGLPGYETSVWFGVFAPRGTPKEIVDKLYGWARDMEKDPGYRKKLTDIYYQPVTLSPEEFQDKINKEAPVWEQAVREFGLSIE
jgi:tripartite-type tricarboxylate transporter receptor subunit TctC